MKRRRHDIVELSSDDSFDDFVPAKLKSKRVSIVLNKDPVSLRNLKSRKNGSSKSCKNSQEQSSSSKQTDQLEADREEDQIPRRRGRPRKDDRPRIRLTMKLPFSSHLTEKGPVDRTAKLKPEFSDLDDSLLIETLKPGPTKISPNQSSVNEEISNPKPVEHSGSEKSEDLQTGEDVTKLSSPIHSSTLLTGHTSPLLPSSGTSDTPKQEEPITHENNHVSLDSNGGEAPDSNGGEAPDSNGGEAPDSNGDTATSLSPDAENSDISEEKNTSDLAGTSNDLNDAEDSKQESKDLRSSTRNTADCLGYSFCQICQKNITGYSADRRSSHVNKCCDELEQANNFGSRNSLNSQGKRRIPSRVNCPICPKNYCDKSSLKKHLKSCCKEHGKCYRTVCEVYFSSSKTALDDDSNKNDAAKKIKLKDQQPTALVVENHSAINKAQNKILDLVADQDSEDIPATPALKASKLTTYRSKRNSIWNVAGSATTTVTNVLKHENSLINTPKVEDNVQPLPASVPDDPICLEKSSLPSQADITQLTQFLTDLGKDDSMKERLTNLMLSPSKLKTDSASASQGSVENPPVTEGPTKLVEYKCPDVKTIQIQNSFKKKSDCSLNGRVKSKNDSVRTDELDEESIQVKKEPNSEQSVCTESEKELMSVEASEPASINHIGHSLQYGSDPDPKADEDTIPKTENVPNENITVTDRSPNPSDISAVGDSSHIRTPARDTSEIVSSIRDAESSLPDQCSIQEDSNLDLFGDDAVTGMEREVFDRSPDRSLLNVSPITDSGLNEVEEEEGEGVKPSVSVETLEENTREISPIYRAKQCSSTTRDCDVLTVPIPLSHKNIQVDQETRNSAVGTDIATRAKGTNTHTVQCRSEACNTDSLDKSSVQIQADGDNRLSVMMRRLLAHTPSTDVTLLCTDWTEKHAHRVILNVSCPALLACSDSQNSDGNPLVKLEIGPEAADRFLEYVYTQRIESEAIRPVILSELFDIAERLDMAELTNHLHTKRTETIEFEFEQESGAKIQLNLSAQDVLNLSQQIEIVSSQNRSIASLDNTLQQDIPSFQEHDIFPMSSPTACDGSEVHLLDGDLFDEVGVSSPPPPSEECEIVDGVNDGNSSDFEDLPATGILLDGAGETEATPPPSPTADMTEEDRRVSQLIQDVEFIDLVKKLDDPIVNSPLSFIDNLSPIKLDAEPSGLVTEKEISVIDLEDQNSNGTSETPTSGEKLSESTPKFASKNKGVVRRSTLSTPSHLNVSEYSKTPNFKGMNTPRLKAEVGKYGLKPLSKKRAVAKLEEIHRFTNKKFLKCPTELEDDKEKSDSKKTESRHGLKVDSWEPTMETDLQFIPGIKKAKGYDQNAVLNGFRYTRDERTRKSSGMTYWKCSLHYTHHCKARITTVHRQLASPLPDHTHHLQRSVHNSGRKAKTSKSQSNKAPSTTSLSSKVPSSRTRKRKNSSTSSSSDKECPVGDITVSEKLPKSAAREVCDQVRSAIRSKEVLHCQVLTYQPVDILEIKGLLKRRTSVGLIAQVLDDLGITYFNSDTKAKGFGRKGGGGKKPKK